MEITVFVVVVGDGFVTVVVTPWEVTVTVNDATGISVVVLTELTVVGDVKVVVTVVVLVWGGLGAAGSVNVDFSVVVTMLVCTVVLTLVTMRTVGVIEEVADEARS